MGELNYFIQGKICKNMFDSCFYYYLDLVLRLNKYETAPLGTLRGHIENFLDYDYLSLKVVLNLSKQCRP